MRKNRFLERVLANVYGLTNNSSRKLSGVSAGLNRGAWHGFFSTLLSFLPFMRRRRERDPETHRPVAPNYFGGGDGKYTRKARGGKPEERRLRQAEAGLIQLWRFDDGEWRAVRPPIHEAIIDAHDMLCTKEAA